MKTWPQVAQSNLSACDVKGDDLSHMYDRTTWPYRKDCPDEWTTLCGRLAHEQNSLYSLTDVDCADCHEAAITRGYGYVDRRNGTILKKPS